MSGVIVIDKPAGLTSRQVVDRVERLVRPYKAGHAGTLDPLATGVLVVAYGAATRLIPYLTATTKAYRAMFRFGLTSDTDDITGQLTTTAERVEIRDPQLREAIAGFMGRQQQVPPQYSAIHVAGQRAYKLARQGKTVDLQPREIEIFSATLIGRDGDDLTVDIVCTAGTYIRSIGRDLGQQLGCGAVMIALQRTAVGRFIIADAVPLDHLDAESLPHARLTPAAALADWPSVRLSVEEQRAVRQGKGLPCGADLIALPNEQVCLLDDASGELIAIAEIQRERQRLQPRVVFPPSGV